eukprot:TRINITY_DN32359_c0_g1_i1.p1 TRINITY_DN32359_c0_g1~~TRINITY_DN32359_c0_g1_i1.p1  ORF type:complete len:132 (-),score=22.58 TRINITY_DN32359_c0_g1_i1:6-401(-)
MTAAKLSLALAEPKMGALAPSHQLIRASQICKTAISSQARDWPAVVRHASHAIECSALYMAVCDPLTVAQLHVSRAIASCAHEPTDEVLASAQQDIGRAHKVFELHLGPGHVATLEVKNALEETCATAGKK